MFQRRHLFPAFILLVVMLYLVSVAAPAVTLAAPEPTIQVSDPALPGPYQVGFQRVKVTRPDATQFDAMFYYPAGANGRNAAYDGSGAPYPAVVFGHGFLTSVRMYVGNAQHLVSWGYFMLLPMSAMELFPSHPAFADDFSYSLDYLEAQNANSASFLYQQIDTDHFGASGHSMGGGVSILAAAQDSRIQAVLNLAAAETFPDSAIDAMAGLHVPIALLAGTGDIIAPPQRHQQPMYDNGHAPRLLAILDGANHCSFAAELRACGGTMDPAYQLQITNRWTTAFFNLYLKGKSAYATYIWGPEMLSEPDVATQFDAGFTLTPFQQTKTGFPGDAVSYSLTLTNTGPTATRFTLTAKESAWPTALSPVHTPLLNPGASTTITALVTIPLNPNPPSDTALIVATTDLDGLTVQVGLLTTQLP